ncbi:MAG: tetratricopeptide repeat protein [Planctomycetota bacterium]
MAELKSLPCARIQLLRAVIVSIGFVGIGLVSEAAGQHFGGGVRGGGHGGAARPSMGMGGGAHPSGGMSRPGSGVSRPATGALAPPSRPSLPSVGHQPATRPNLGTAGSRPSLGVSGDSAAGRPSVIRPSINPPLPMVRPTITPEVDLRPSLGSVRPVPDRPVPDRPSLDRPALSKPFPTKPLPGKPDIAKPDTGKPLLGKPLPGKPDAGDRPGIGDRPIVGRPMPMPRPTPKPLPVDRPIVGPPGVKPFPGERPVVGVKQGFVQRPVVGGRPGNANVNYWMGNGFNFNVNAGVRPSWGYGEYHWGHHWHDHHVHHHHHGWYHGCWSGHWGSYWYVPAVVGASYWGFTALSNAWGYDYYYGYRNPYYTVPVAGVAIYDYSRPIVINSYVSADDASGTANANPTTPSETASERAGYRLFDQAREAFRRSDFLGAQKLVEQALKQLPNDPVLHEFYALCLFANRQYQSAAAVLNPLLAVAPGMDWTTMISLYASSDEYTRQLRSLENHCTRQPEDSAAAFVVAYHYLICGHADDAKKALDRVIKTRPNDQVALRIRDSLKGDEEPAAVPEPPAPSRSSSPAPATPRTGKSPDSSPTPATAATTAATATDATAADAPTTDLIGTWRAERDGDMFELAIDDQGQFRWNSTPHGKPAAVITGGYSVADDALVMDSAEQGTMAGQVISKGADQFQFVIVGGPPGDKGLAFQRVKLAP